MTLFIIYSAFNTFCPLPLFQHKELECIIPQSKGEEQEEEKREQEEEEEEEEEEQEQVKKEVEKEEHETTFRKGRVQDL